MTADDQQTTGATVYAVISRCNVGDALHRLEYHADVHLLDRIKNERAHTEIWKLRSDQFPAAWDKKDIVLVVHKGVLGLEFVPQ